MTFKSEIRGPKSERNPKSLLGLMVRVVEFNLVICLTSLLATGCTHIATDTHQAMQPPSSPELERRSTEAEIRQYVVGKWTAVDGSNRCWYPTLIIGGDHNLIGLQANGKREAIGTWELSGTSLRVTPSPARFEEARKSGYQLNAWDYYPVIYADDHELVMTPGISVGGRWRYTR